MATSCATIGLGTAQFGNAYGVSNAGQIVSDHDVDAMLVVARTHGIRTIDTAVAYGKAEERLGKNNLSDFDIVTKVVAPLNGKNLGYLETQIQQSLSRLGVGSLDAVLVHNAEAVCLTTLAKVLGKLEQMIGRGICRRIGVSLYDPQKIIEIAKTHRVDLVQVPFNVIDQRLSDGNVLSWCQKQNIDVHVRSVFLQGLLLMDRSELPDYFIPWLDILDKWSAWNCMNNTNLIEGAFGFVNGYRDQGISRFVIGCSNAEQLSAIIRYANAKACRDVEALRCDDLKLINPAFWSLS
jgi:aryl-alcohol dehydrogenase-like predicted oxidoreductase